MKLRLLAFAVATALLAGTVPDTATAAIPVPPFIADDAPWLQSVNYFRAMAGLPPVVENTTWSAGDHNHACYMLANGMSHDEIPGRPLYTPSGDAAGNASNVAVNSTTGVPARSFIELWMTGPFHAIGILRHNLRTVGYGQCENEDTPRWRSGAALNVISGLVNTPRPANPIVWPGDGTTTNLSQFIAETPNPVTMCGWQGTVGLPLIAMMPEPINTISSTIVRQDGVAIQSCALYAGNTTGDAKAILGGDNAATIIPNSVLLPGSYTVTVTTQARTVTWSFTVDPAAADLLPAAPTATPLGTPSGLTPIAPFRLLDSRINLRSTALLPGVPKRIRVAGVAGIPTNATAVQANITTLGSSNGTSSYLTVYPCTATAPAVSTVNFGTGGAVANGGIYPLQAGTGDLCFYTPAGTNYIVDIAGYYTANSGARYTPSPLPARLTDTRDPAGLTSGNHADAGSTLHIPVPADAAAHTLTVVATNTTSGGYLTVYPCDMPMPVVSNLNYRTGDTRSNLAVVPASADGNICIYTSGSTDIIVDLYGTYQQTGELVQPTTPFRLIDTRNRYQTAMWLTGTNQPLPAAQTVTIQAAGVRGIPNGISTLFVNVVITGADQAGWARVAPCDTPNNVSTINYSAGATRAGAAAIPVPASGQICVTTSVTAHVVIDVTGWAI